MPQETIQGFRLAPQQRHLWDLRRGDDDAFVAVAEIELPATVETERLEKGLTTLVERHEVLRTGYRLLEGMRVPLQVVLERAAVDFVVHEPADRADESSVRSLGRELVERAFDLERGPILRAALIRRPDAASRLVLVLPGLSADASSLGDLAGELGELLADDSTGEDGDQERLQFIDLSEWQHELLEAEETEAGRQHWRRLDVGRRFEPRLPGEALSPRPGPFRPTSVEIPSGLAPGPLADLAEAAGTDLDAILLAAWQWLLARLTETGDLVVGVGTDGRRYEELQGVPGLFARVLPLTAELEPHGSFAELARTVRKAWDEASSWQESFAWDLLTLDPNDRGEDDPSTHYCPFVFEVQPEVAAGALIVRRRETVADRFHLRLTVVHCGSDIDLRLDFDPRLYGEAVARDLLERLRAILGALGDRSGSRLGDIEILHEEERRLLLHTWNATEPAELPPRATLPTLFEEQVSHTPEEPAVVAGSERLSYRELARKAHRLAHELRARGVGPESRVGIFLEHSAEMVTAVLGTLQAGAGYVPIDPAYPAARVTFLARDSGITATVTRRRLLERLPDDAVRDVAVLLLDEDEPAISSQPATLPESGPEGEHLAYVIYTSGSTGQPKGVAVEHRQLTASTHARRAHYRRPVKAFLLLSSFSFDSSIAGLFWTLRDGGALVLPPPGFEDDLGALVEVMRRDKVSHLLCVPSLYSRLLESLGDEGLSDLRVAIVAGEACGRELVQRHFSLLPKTELHNEYGPTEATVWATAQRLDDGEPMPIAIGRPIVGARVYLLDPRLRPVAIGATGELFLAGAGLTRGYLGRPSLTAKRFIPDPFADRPGERLYRSGDLARYRTNGALEFLGRRDQQVKIRGFRIELGEIEAALRSHPAVSETVVLAPENARGEPRLVAYIVAPDTETSALKAFLAERLPEPLVPAIFISLEAMPRTVHGKIDHGALSSPEEALGERAYVAPRTATEETVAEVWAEILEVERVSADSDFLELGGHSLAATQSVARLRDIFQIELTGRSHFENPSLSDLAALIDRMRREGAEVRVPPLEPRSPSVSPDDLPLSFAQKRLWLIDQLDPGSAAYNIPASVRLYGPFDAEILAQAVSLVVRRHEVLRTAFVSHADEPRLEVRPEVPMDVLTHDLSHLDAEEREARIPEIALEEIRRPFDLARAPLLRVRLIRTSPEEHVALLVVHHIVADGWSLGILIREIVTAYRAHLTDDEPEPAPLSIQYADYAAWQRNWLDQALESQLSYWRRQLEGLEDLELPVDHPRPAVQVSRGKRQLFEVPQTTVDALRRLGRSERATFFMVLLAAFKVLLRAYAGNEDIAVGTNVANRERPETEGLIGFFVNQIVLRTRVEAGLSFRELLARVKKTAIDGFAHQDVPFEKLVEELRPKRQRDRHLLYQVKVELQNAPPRIPEIPGVTLGGVEVDRGMVRYDLHLYFEERDEGLAASLQYDSDLFEPTTIETMVELTTGLLQRIGEAPESLVEELTTELRKARKKARMAMRHARRRDRGSGLRSL